MTHKRKRCIHCSKVYTYQASGHGCHHELNDSLYCPGCKAAIVKALSEIPKRFEKRYIEVTSFDPIRLLQEVERINAELEQKRKENPFGIYARRVHPGLCNTKTGEWQKSEHLTYEGVELIVEWWESTVETEGYTVRQAMEYDLKQKLIVGHWRSFR